jgi:hypothetical protein
MPNGDWAADAKHDWRYPAYTNPAVTSHGRADENGAFRNMCVREQY